MANASPEVLAPPSADQATTVARNLSTRYLAIAIDAGLGVVLLPFNVAHLGQSSYGLWILTASVTGYLSVLEMGYSGAIVKFVAQYRARRDVTSLNEVLSTLFCVLATCAAIMFATAVGLSLFIDRVFHVTPEQVGIARIVLLVVSVNVAMTTAFSVFGGVISGFQRYDLNNVVGTLSTIVGALVNVIVLQLGFGLVTLVVSLTLTRVLTLFIYRLNAYRVFPALRIRPSSFRASRLREVTSFSAHLAVIDWSSRLNYSIDALVIGAFMNTSAVAIWAVAQRLSEFVQRLSNQLNEILFPTIVENDTAARTDRLQRIFLDGTRLSLGIVLPLGVGLALLAEPLIMTWVGPNFTGSIILLQLLSLVSVVRIGTSTGTSVLKGAGRHRLLAATNALTAVCNVGLSIALIGRFNQVGVAIGTLVPVTVAALLVIMPVACRRVQLPMAALLRRAVWPAAWPAFVMGAYLVLTRAFIPRSLIAVGLELGVAGLIYAGIFTAFSMLGNERRFLIAKVRALLPIQRPRQPQEVT